MFASGSGNAEMLKFCSGRTCFAGNLIIFGKFETPRGVSAASSAAWAGRRRFDRAAAQV